MSLLARAALMTALCLPAMAQAQQQWIVATEQPRVAAGATFEILVIAPVDEELPDRLDARLTASPADERVIPLHAQGVPVGGQRLYSATLPAGMSGTVAVELAGRASSMLLLEVASTPPGPFEILAGRGPGDVEPPISENDPMYFIVGSRGPSSARFQLSFKYRLFDQSSGFGREQAWLAGIYFGYTQNSLWDLSGESRPFRDTSYRPSLFWRWQRTDDRTWIDELRIGYEHESNGGAELRSRSIDTLFIRPEWRWNLADDARLEFTPKFYGYLDKEENPDIDQYRGHVDWRVRYDSGLNWITTGVARVGKSGKGSVLLDVSRRIRDLRFGPVGGYLHIQYFRGYGEDILGYDQQRKSQLRIGFAIVP